MRIIIFFLIIFFNIVAEKVEMEEKKYLSESLKNIIFGEIEKNNILMEIQEVKKISFNNEIFIIITFKLGRKIIVKNEKKLKINEENYIIRVGRNKKIELENEGKQIIYIETE